MKILVLRLTNLNSLRGTTEIDFSKPPFSTTGLFAITGQTGAGKTTLLDAITLALYGRVARYGNDRNPDSVMSRGTGECSAEVEFTCAAGIFRSVWQLQRSHRKSSGRIQPARRRIIEVSSETVVTEKIEDSDRKIVELTGLDYNRFLRSALLAQGEFAAFLRSDPKERTELLQQVTGTAIYKEISQAAYRRCDTAKQAYETLRTSSSAVPVMDAAARKEHEDRQASLLHKLAKVGEDWKVITSRMEIARRWNEYVGAQRQLDLDAEAHALAKQTAAPSLERLLQHERATPLNGPLATWDQLSKEQVRENARRLQIEEKLPELQQKLDQSVNACRSARDSLKQSEQQQEESIPLWNKVADLDSRVTAARKTHQLSLEQLDTCEKRVLSAQTGQQKLVEQLNQISEKYTALDTLLKDHACDASLAVLLPDIQAAASRWQANEQAIREHMEERTRLQQSLDKQRKEIAATQTELGLLEKAFAEKHTAVTEAISHLDEVGMQMTLETLMRSQEESRVQADILERLHIDAERLRIAEASLKQKQEERISLETDLEKRSGDYGRVIAQHEEAVKLTESNRRALSLAERMQSLEDHRASLRENEPCPLCGAIHHPYASAEIITAKELEQARLALEQSIGAEKQIEKSLKQLASDTISIQATLKRCQAEINQLEKDLIESRREWNNRSTPLKLEDQYNNKSLLETKRVEARAEAERLTRQLNAVRLATTKLQAARDAAAIAGSRVTQKQADLSKAEALATQTTDRLPMLAQAIAKGEKDRQAAQLEFAKLVKAFVEPPVTVTAVEALINTLKSRAANYNQQQTEVQSLGTQKTVQTEKVKSMAEQLEAFKTARQDAQKLTIRAKAEWDGLVKERQELFGARSVEQEQQTLATRIKQSRTACDTAANAMETLRTQHANLGQEKRTLSESLERRNAELETSLNELLTKALAAGFSSVELLRAALLTATDANELITLRQQLHSAGIALESRNRALQALREQLPADAAQDAGSLDKLQESREQLEAERSGMERTLGELGNMLKTDDENRQRLVTYGQQIETARMNFQRWNSLRELIGSADGANFARFAQGLTLERLTHLANAHLVQLNPRYTIRRVDNEATDLELEVVDHYQADSTRQMRSLSGGESFLVSLSLALGLSELARGRSSIESLFIDEGFSTLDSDTLETAMAALDNLQASGKVIGVISHMHLLQERITAQIRVIKDSGGCSHVEIV